MSRGVCHVTTVTATFRCGDLLPLVSNILPCIVHTQCQWPGGKYTHVPGVWITGIPPDRFTSSTKSLPSFVVARSHAVFSPRCLSSAQAGDDASVDTKLPTSFDARPRCNKTRRCLRSTSHRFVNAARSSQTWHRLLSYLHVMQFFIKLFVRDIQLPTVLKPDVCSSRAVMSSSVLACGVASRLRFGTPTGTFRVRRGSISMRGCRPRDSQY